MENSEVIKTTGLAAPSGTVTFLFTDIEGSTRLLEQLREHYAILMDEQRQILRAAFARWNGSEIDTQGDAFFTVFPRAMDAVCCVMETQRELAGHAWPRAAVVRVRMGLHTGEPIQVHSGYVGMDVHRAARIAAAGHGGQVLLSQTTRDLVYQDLPKGTALRDLGEHKLKDIRYPQQIYQLEVDGLEAAFPPLKSLSFEEEPPTPGEPPYKGLQYFDEGDAGWFYGQEQASQQLAQAVQGQRFLAVIGASGSGKSSVLRAGLVPALKRSQPGRWQVHILTPTSRPLESLAVSLTRGEQSVTAAAILIDDLRCDPRSLHLYVRRSISQGSQAEALLVIDQFEELFTQCRDEAERQAFVDNLLYAAGVEDSPVRVVIALRADFYQHLAQYAGLRGEVAKHQEYLGAMEADELRQAIEAPAQRGGWEFSPGLVDLILHDIGASAGRQPEPGALPLLSHALLETWKRRRGNLMNLRAYSEAGGVRGAIARTAESVYYGELTPEQQPIARNIFLRLTELGEGTQDTRRRVAISELVPPAPYGDPKEVEAVLVKLADARLITTGEGTAEVAHEALIREWPTLREWLSEDREGLRIHRHLTDAAQEWELLERDPGALYRGARLAQAMEWCEANPSQLNVQEKAFLDACQEAVQREAAEREAQRQRELEAAQKLAEAEKQRAEEQADARRRVERWASFLAISLSLVVFLAIAAFYFAQQSNRNTRIATARELASAALASLQSDPERSILLALEAIKTEPLWEAQNALHQALFASHLRDTLAAHDGGIYGIAASSDGNRLGTAGLDGTIKIWQIKDGRIEKQPLLTIPNPVDYDPAILGSGTTMAFSPDNSKLATFGPQFSVLILDAASGETLQTISGHTAELTSLAFNSTGNRLLTSSADSSARLWDVPTGTELVVIQNDSGEELVMAAFSPDGELIATGGTDSVVRIWDLSGVLLAELPIENGDVVTAIAFSPDGHLLAAGSPFSHRAWDLSDLAQGQSPKLVLTTPGENGAVNGIYFSPDGRWLVTANSSGKTKIWDVSTGQVLLDLLPSEMMISSAAAPDGKSLFIGYENGQVKAWNIGTLGNGEWFSLPYQYSNFHSSEPRILSWNFSNREHGIFNKSWWSIQGDVPQKINSYSIEFGGPTVAGAQDDALTRLAMLDEDGLVKIYDSADGRFLLSLTSGSDDAKIETISMSADGSRLITTTKDGLIRLWDTSTGDPLIAIQAADQPQFAFSSPDGSLIVSHDQQPNPVSQPILRIWDAASGKKLHELVGHTGRIFGGTFTPDGKYLMTCSTDGTVKIWDVTNGNALRTISNFNGLPFGLRISPDGRLLAVEQSNLNTSLYDLSSGQELLDLSGWWASFSPDSRHLSLGSTNEEMTYGYDLELEDLVRLAESRVTRSLEEAECQKYLHAPTCQEEY